jgi:hypothetical protein
LCRKAKRVLKRLLLSPGGSTLTKRSVIVLVPTNERCRVLKPNYQFEKRQRENEKKKKKAEKAQRKALGLDDDAPQDDAGNASAPAAAENTPAPADKA